MKEQIEKAFNIRSVSPEQAARAMDVKVEIKNVAHVIDDNAPNSREKALALTKLEEAWFWALAAISREESEDTK
ncbi:DUF7681 family protein [Aureibacillus halotolerans]|uniref:Acb2/Tad1 hairpin domain-containing protein n=1 Tax=Aureibacillus halotolerans TaxID=1508390 RepID=A0A4R6TYZ9_9BACI|nr:hypothetical protein [Aureibacillus halotolerans]TDQ39198.1 hypothetical protein EV213_108150 [Aureibacillus halotolerans]